MKNLFDIKDKVIIVTGGCGILGKSIANYLAEQGAKIVILDRVEEAGRELEAELNRKSEALFLVTDVLNKEVLEENKKAILERFGTIDVLPQAATCRALPSLRTRPCSTSMWTHSAKW